MIHIKQYGAQHIIRTQYVVPMGIISPRMNLPDATSMKLNEKECDLWSGSRLANTVRSDGVGLGEQEDNKKNNGRSGFQTRAVQ